MQNRHKERLEYLTLTVSVTFTWLLWHTGGLYGIPVKTRQLFVSSMPLAYNAADIYCKSRNGNIARVRTSIQFVEVVEKAIEEHLSALWMPVTRVVLDGFIFVNGSKADKLTISKRGPCVFIDIDTVGARSTKCSSLWLGHVCQLKGEIKCLNLTTPNRQMQIDGDCFQIIHEKANWYDARWLCEQKKQVLATPKSDAQINRLKTTIKETYGIFGLAYFWIGIRSEDFILNNQSTRYYDSSTTPFFKFGEPSHVGNCIVALIEHNSAYWETRRCSSKYNVVCEVKASYNTKTTTTSSAQIISRPTCLGSNSTSDVKNQERNTQIQKLAYALGTCLSIIILSIIGIVLFYIKVRKSRVRYGAPPE